MKKVRFAALVAAAVVIGGLRPGFAEPSNAAAPGPLPTPGYYGFIAGGYTGGKVYNEFSSGQKDSRSSSYVASGAYLLDRLAFKVDIRQDQYDSTDNTGLGLTVAPTIGGGASIGPVFTGRQTTFDGRLELQLLDPHLYAGLGYLQSVNNYGNPHLRGAGVGLEKLPDFNGPLGVHFSAFYYPNVSGTYTVSDSSSANFGNSYVQAYKLIKYDLGFDVPITQTPVYVNGGFSGDRFYAKANAARDQTHSGPYVGLGLHF
ncbi:MAG: hypothetical protein GIW99_11140 [Candidatus Eremiobacteraeota bacterium]|nr:hypothetical protein [Candidatus Eremiobacteraeota bacterium]MBC5828215.1 hypothetical protein [Candidatus Eremiobacteraeota bacterium]